MGSLVAALFRGGPPDERRLQTMFDVAPHRGDSTRHVASGRSILGISDHADRPEGDVAEADGSVAAITGSLDNAAELARELDANGRPLDPRRPAAVVLEGFRVHGDAFLGRMRGVYAGAVSDGETLWSFRDHIGFRTLFYRDDPGMFLVATEAKQVVAGAGIPKEPDLDVLESIFFREFTDSTPAALRGVRRIPKASVVRVSADGAGIRRYWDPASLIETGPSLDDDELLERFEQIMTQATGRTLTGNDVVSLSGGIDSPAVAAFAAPQHLERYGAPLSGLSALYPDQPSVDESAYIEEVASFLGLPLFTYDRRAEPLGRVREWTELVDGPVPRLLLSDAEEHFAYAKKFGFRSMLTGEIAEFVIDMRRFLLAHLLRRGRLRPLYEHIRDQHAKGASPPGIAKQLASAFVPRSLELLYMNSRTLPDGLRPPAWMDEDRYNRSSADFAVAAGERWRQQQLLGFIGPGLTLEAEEIAEDALGVRLRRPWADVDLWEFFLSLPAEQKFPTVERKGLVRKLLRGRVPDVILDRRDKTVFDASIEARIDYGDLRRWLLDPRARIGGVDYELLADQLRSETLDVPAYQWARDLAQVHAFLSLWE